MNIPYLFGSTYIVPGGSGCAPGYNPPSQPYTSLDTGLQVSNCSMVHSFETMIGMGLGIVALGVLVTAKGGSKILSLPLAYASVIHLIGGGGGF